jgi:hypothetical protein
LEIGVLKLEFRALPRHDHIVSSAPEYGDIGQLDSIGFVSKFNSVEIQRVLLFVALTKGKGLTA